MEFEWVDAKRRANIAKHRIDFLDVRALFDGRPIFTITTRRNDEDRSVSTGNIDGRLCQPWSGCGETRPFD